MDIFSNNSMNHFSDWSSSLFVATRIYNGEKWKIFSECSWKERFLVSENTLNIEMCF